MTEHISTDIILEIENLEVTNRAQDKTASIVRDVHLAIRKREIFCLIGESGSGKSVTASAVIGLLPARTLSISKGSIRLDGQELVGAGEQTLRKLRGNRVSMVFQEPMTALNPLMRVGDQIAEVIQTHRPEMSDEAIRKQVLALMRDVHLPEPDAMIDAYPHQLSGGQRQRIVIAMAIALDPVLIIADEPTTALDVTTQAQVLKLFKELQEKHDSGILFITHDFDVVRTIADRVAVMKQGEIVETGTAQAVLTTPQHEYTRTLLAAVPHGRPKLSSQRQDAPLLEVKNVHLTYDSRSLLGKRRVTHAIDDVSFVLDKGEILGIVGESGSGKSSLGRCITRSNPVTSGEILFQGIDITALLGKALTPIRRRIQMIFQDPFRSLNPRHRIMQALTEGPVEAGVPAATARTRAAELMKLVGLPQDSLLRYPHQFSGGQRQRICIARALAMDPEVIIADEAVSALDVSVQAQVLELFESLQKQLGFAMVFITHDLRVATQLCDRIAVMQKGKLVELATAADLLAAPRHEYTRQLFAAAPGAAWSQAA